MGAYLTMVTSVPGVRPMSRMCWCSATSSELTCATTASLPISSSSSLMRSAPLPALRPNRTDKSVWTQC